MDIDIKKDHSNNDENVSELLEEVGRLTIIIQTLIKKNKELEERLKILEEKN